MHEPTRSSLPAFVVALLLFLVALPLNSSLASPGAAAPGVQAEIPASGDATVDSYTGGGDGAGPRLTVAHSVRPPGEQRALLQFDLQSALPANAVIDSAQLHLYLAEFTGAASVTLTTYLLTRPWSEADVTWSSSLSDSTPGGSQSVPSTTGEYTWDITGIAQAWQVGQNFGLVLKGPEGTGDEYSRAFESRESRGHIPHVVITYHTPVTPTPTNTPLPPSPTPTAISQPDTTPPTNPTTLTADRPANTWSNLPAVQMSWSGASDGRGSGVHGYSFQWATSTRVLPDTIEDTNQSSVRAVIPADGATWYFLVRTVDNAGNWAPDAAVAGPYPLDTVPPTNPTVTTVPAADGWSKDNTISAAWTNAVDNPGGSGIAGYSTLFSTYGKDRPDDVIDTDWNTDGSGVVADGQWYFHLITRDVAGNWTPGKVGAGPIKIDATAPSSHAGKGEHEVIPVSIDDFPVRISGVDNASGIKVIVVQYRDVTENGGWLLWLASAQPDQQYTFLGNPGHLYCFRTQAIDNAGNVENWPAQADTCVAAANADIVAEKLALTQGIQNYDGDGALVAGRRTFARCYVNSELGDLDDVSARLVVRNSQGVQLGVLKPLNAGGTIDVKQSPNRGAFDDSFFFEIPVGWVTTAGGLYSCNVNLDGKYWEKTLTNNTKALSTNALQAPPALKVALIDMPYWHNGVLRKPRWDDVWAIESYLKRMYPITQLKVLTGYFSPAYSSRPSKDTALDDLTAVWIHEVFFNNGDEDLFWYGMISNDGGNVGGLAWRPGQVGVGSTGPQALGCSISDGPWDLDDSCGDHVAAHELGHSLGRKHVKCTGTEAGVDSNYPYANGRISAATTWTDPNTWYGFDAEDNRIMGPTWTDVMGYCQNQWISNYTYFAIYNAVRATAQSTALAAALAEPRSEQLWVSASVSPADVVTLRPFKRIPDGASISPGGPGEYSIRLLGAGNAVLASYPVAVHFEEPEEPGVLAATVPWVAGTQAVAIYHGSTLLASRPVSANAPSVALLFPNGGERLEGAGVTVRWSGSDPDGDALSYDIEYSTDGGAHWQMLGTRVTGNEAEISLERLPGSQQARFRVWATDGVNSARDASDANFVVPTKAPVAGILSPKGLLRTSFGQLITFEGSATDPEDGSIDEGSLQWSSNLAGALGSGSLLQTSELVTGTHTITLRAVDSHGQAGSTSLTVLIGLESTYLPLIVR